MGKSVDLYPSDTGIQDVFGNEPGLRIRHDYERKRHFWPQHWVATLLTKRLEGEWRFHTEGEHKEHGMFETPEDTMNATGHQILELGEISKYKV